MNIDDKNTDRVDMNRDPITGSPGSHPAGTALGSAGGAAIGAAAGLPAGPIGMLIGGTIGAVVGAAAGHTAAEALDPTGEVEYWRSNYATRPYVERNRDFDTDYKPAYLYGVKVREDWRDRPWDDSVEQELQRKWEQTRGTSTLTWPQARPAVYDAWDRANRSYLTYDGYDSYYRSRFDAAEYRDPAYAFPDYRSAYRFGTWARHAYPDRSWDDAFDADLSRQWSSARGDSTLSWEQARAAARDAWSYTPRAEVG